MDAAQIVLRYAPIRAASGKAMPQATLAEPHAFLCSLRVAT
jgi:hypothetical protein